MAHLSEDAGLIEAFNSGEDLHNYVASRVFGVEPSDGRRRACAARSRRCRTAWPTACRRSASRSSSAITPAEASGLMDEYFERFGGVRDYLREVVDRARGTGYTETMLGRRRYLPDLTSDVRQRREMAERMALNAPIQGSAADIVKVAMLRVDAALHARRARLAHAAAGARRARPRGGAGRARGGARPWCARAWAARCRSLCRSTCRSASGAPGRTPGTDGRALDAPALARQVARAGDRPSARAS